MKHDQVNKQVYLYNSESDDVCYQNLKKKNYVYFWSNKESLSLMLRCTK